MPVAGGARRRGCRLAAAAGRSTASLGWLFAAFNSGFDVATSGYLAAVGGAAARRAARALVYGGLLCLTYYAFTTHADRVHPAAGQGLPARQRAAARRRVARPHRGADAADRGDRPRDARRQAHGQRVRPVDPAQRQRAELRLAVRHARRVPRPPHARPARPTPSRAKLRSGLSASRCRRRSSTSSAPRRWTGWAPPAGSRSMIEDRGDTGPSELAAGGRRRGRERRRDEPDLRDVFTSFRADTPWLYLDIDRDAGARRWACRWRRLQHAAGLLRLALRQRLQPVRPDLAGERPGRRAVPQAGRRPASRLKVRNDERRDGAARRRSLPSRT